MVHAVQLQIQQGVCLQLSVESAGENVLLDRFNRIAWGQADGSRPEGVIAAGMENGELAIWDPSKIVSHARCVLTSFVPYFGMTRPR